MSTSVGSQQISGLASGLDTASIISALMQIDRQPQIRIQQKIVVEQARQQGLRAVLASLNQLTTSYQSLTDVGTWADVQSVASTNDAMLSATRTGGAAPGSYAIDVTALARANQYTGSFGVGVTAVAADDVLHIATGTGTTDVAVAAGDSLDTVAGKVNGATGSPVYASVLNGKLVFSNKQTGVAAKVTGVTTNGTSGLSFAETQTAQDAAFTIDGTPHTSGSNIATDALAGIMLTLKGKVTGAYVTVGTPGADTDGIQKKLQAFVTQYNATISLIMGKVDERPIAAPQNDADRAVGALSGDAGLTGLLGTLRNSFADLVGGRPANLQSFAQIGLSTGAATGSGSLNSDSIDGKLTIDSAKFSSALSTNFADVKALFTNPTGSYATEGLAQRLGGILKPWTATSASNGLLNLRIDGETTTLSSLGSQSVNWDQRLKLREEMLQKQFTLMETALSKAQSQSSWLNGQIAQLGK